MVVYNTRQLEIKGFRAYFPLTFDINTTVSTWHEEMILLAHTSYLFAQSRIGTYPPFWALGCSPMQEHIDKLEFVYMIPDTSLHQHNDVGVFDLDNLFCFQSDLFC